MPALSYDDQRDRQFARGCVEVTIQAMPAEQKARRFAAESVFARDYGYRPPWIEWHTAYAEAEARAIRANCCQGLFNGFHRFTSTEPIVPSATDVPPHTDPGLDRQLASLCGAWWYFKNLGVVILCDHHDDGQRVAPIPASARRIAPRI